MRYSAANHSPESLVSLLLGDTLEQHHSITDCVEHSVPSAKLLCRKQYRTPAPRLTLIGDTHTSATSTVDDDSLLAQLGLGNADGTVGEKGLQ